MACDTFGCWNNMVHRFIEEGRENEVELWSNSEGIILYEQVHVLCISNGKASKDAAVSTVSMISSTTKGVVPSIIMSLELPPLRCSGFPLLTHASVVPRILKATTFSAMHILPLLAGPLLCHEIYFQLNTCMLLDQSSARCIYGLQCQCSCLLEAWMQCTVVWFIVMWAVRLCKVMCINYSLRS